MKEKFKANTVEGRLSLFKLRALELMIEIVLFCKLIRIFFETIQMVGTGFPLLKKYKNL